MKRNFTRLLLSAVLMMCCAVRANAQITAPAGDGTKGKPYQICNFEHLVWFTINIYNELISNDACAILMNDIESDGSPWIPIGYDDEHVYCGEFDGNGHVIKGLHYDREEVDVYSGLKHKDHCIGLFGKLDDKACIHDVGVENCYFYGQNRVGAICGDLASGEVYNCWSSGYICVNSASGGLVGSCWYDGILRNCYTSCNVVVSEWTDQYVGGVCGSVAGKVENCVMLKKASGWAEKPIGATYGETYVVNNVSAQLESTLGNGKVCWLLNGGVTDGTQSWYQTIGSDIKPTLSVHGTVYELPPLTCETDYTYSNEFVEIKTAHVPVKCTKRTCFASGFNEEYWQCRGCHKVFTDLECTHEIDTESKGPLLNVVKDEHDWYQRWYDTKDKNIYVTTPEFYGWKYESTHEYNKRTYNNAYVLDINCAPAILATSLSFASPKDYQEYPIIWYWYQKFMFDPSQYPFGGETSLLLNVYVNGTLCYRFGEYMLESAGALDYVPFNGGKDENALITLSNLKKDDVIKIEVRLNTHHSYNPNRWQDNHIIFSLPEIVFAHQFKHSDVACQGKEYWECDHCHHLFTSDAHPESDEDICSLQDIHKFRNIDVKRCDGSTFTYWHCDECGKDYQDADVTKKEASDDQKSGHFPNYDMGIPPTEATEGRYGFYKCTKCGEKFKNELCNESWTNDGELIVTKSRNNEIWYATTDNQQIVHGVSYKANEYQYGLGKIVLADDVTEIAANAFNRNQTIQSISIPSSVRSIGNSSLWGCTALKSAYLSSLPNVDKYAFENCNNLTSKILDLTDSNKPYIGTSTANYPGFTEARYHRTLEQGKWGTIVLPFAPTGGMDGLEFYELRRMATNNGGSLVFTKVDAPEAGVPYLVKNVSDSKKDFTLTASNPTVTVNTTGQTAGYFTMKGSFQQKQLNGAENKNLYYLKDNGFYHANGKINIAPFRAYIEGNGASSAKSFMLIVEDDGEIDAIPGILNGDGNIDETEAIYDLNGRRLTAPVKGQVNIIRTKSGKTIKVNFANRAQ